MNLDVALAFSQDCARLGPKVDPLIFRMAKLTPEEARGASPMEFLVVCGILAVGARVAADDQSHWADEALALFEAKADDLRFRVRDAVPLALAMMGSKMKGELVTRTVPWMDRYFHAAAVIRALAEPLWLETFTARDADSAIDLLHVAFLLCHDAPRSAVRYPGHKALMEALASAPRAVAKRFPQKMFERFITWATYVTVPELRDVILTNISGPELKKTWGHEIARVRDAIEQGKKPPRDPTLIRHGTRGRGKKQAR
jgi:hypothetical protein